MPPSHPHSSSRINKHDIRFLIDDPSHSHVSHSHVSRPSRRGTLATDEQPALNPPNLTQLRLVDDITTSHARLPKSGPPTSPTTPRTPRTPRTGGSSTVSKPFACKLCDKTFAERGNANKHYRVSHLKQRNHRCTTCDRSFAFRDGLNRHISMVHLNERPFVCTECMCPGGPHPSSIPCTLMCGMRFKQKSHRRRHVHSVHHAGGRRPDSPAHTPLSPMDMSPHRTEHVS